MKIRSASQTNVGKVRQNNEDALLCDDANRLYAVADGMGGHAAGERASQVAIEVLRTHVGGRKLSDAFSTAHTLILGDARRRPERAGMGTTLTAMSLHPGVAILGHVGDSRCYLIRGGVGIQMTQDHLQAPNILSNCLGGSLDGYKEADLRTIPLRTGDVFILCTDGLSNYMSAAAVAKFVNRHRSSVTSSRFEQTLADRLIHYALAAGGSDNVTAVVFSISKD